MGVKGMLESKMEIKVLSKDNLKDMAEKVKITPEAGVIDISPKGAIKTNCTTFVSPSVEKGKMLKKILIREKNRDTLYLKRI
nr:DUF735 family protein [Borreliella bavariensis]